MRVQRSEPTALSPHRGCPSFSAPQSAARGRVRSGSLHKELQVRASHYGSMKVTLNGSITKAARARPPHPRYRFFSFGNRSWLPRAGGAAERDCRRRREIFSSGVGWGIGALTGSPLTVQVMLAGGLHAGALQLALTVSPSAYLGFSTRSVTLPSGSPANSSHRSLKSVLTLAPIASYESRAQARRPASYAVAFHPASFEFYGSCRGKVSECRGR